jgi:hypothetical protein
VRVPVVVGAGGAEDPREVIEIGLGGLFVATDAPHALRQLVRLRLGRGPGDSLELQGMIVRVVSTVEARRLGAVPGIGVQLYGLGAEVESAWRDYFERSLREAAEPFGDDDDTPEAGELATIAVWSRGRPLSQPVECEEDAVAMLARGFTPDEIAEAAGLDPSMVTAALTGDEAGPVTLDMAPIGQTVEGVSLLASSSSAPPPGVVPVAPVGPISSVIKIIGSSPPPVIAEASAATMPAGEPDARDDDAETLRLRRGERARIRLRALGPLQPPAMGHLRTSRPRLVAAGSAPLAPTGLLPHVVYRLEMVSPEVVEAFGRAAVETGRVVIPPVAPRRPGTPVVVCVVHPTTRDELHLPGAVASTAGGGGVTVELADMPEATRRALDRFLITAELGVPPPAAPPAKPAAAPGPDLAMVRKSLTVGGEAESPFSSDTCQVRVTEVELLRRPGEG